MRFARTLFLLTGLFSGLAFGSTAFALSVSPQSVVDEVMSKGYRAQEIGYETQLSYLGIEAVRSRFAMKLDSKLGYEYSEAEDLSGLANPLDKTYSLGTELSKLTRYGLLMSVAYEHVEQNSVLNPVIATTREPRLSYDQATLSLRQSLLRNYFGRADRLDLKVEESRMTDARLVRDEALEDVVLESLRQFWATYVSQIELRYSREARTRYEQLVDVVGRKGRFGLQKGGELAQVQAELEDAEQKVKVASSSYLKEVLRLSHLMRLETSEDLTFQVEDELPAVPKLEPVDLQNLRKVRSLLIGLDTTDLKVQAVTARSRPQLDLVGRVASTGVEGDFDRSYSELVSGKRPTYFVGLEFSTTLDPAPARAAIAEQRITKLRKESELKRLQDELKENLQVLEYRVHSLYAAAKSAKQAAALREKSVRLQENEYRQGRLPIAELIRVYNSYFQSQINEIRTIGDYHIARNELAAARDELVKKGEGGKSHE